MIGGMFVEAKEIAKLAQIASVLEVSGWPKPGNVHRTRNYDDIRKLMICPKRN